MNVKNLLTTVSHKIHHHEEDPENSFQLSYDVNPVKEAKKPSKNVIKEDEYKSKWDQFCDFTSLNGFRLLSSKFSWAMRIGTATVMLLATFGLCWNVSGAFIKYFNPSGQKNTVVHQGEFQRIELPKIRFCHQSKNARTNVDPDILSYLHEDSRRLLYLYNIESLTVDILKKEKLPHFDYFLSEISNITFKEKNCTADFYKLQNECKNTFLYPKYCSIFRTPPNSTKYEYDNLTFIEMLQIKHDHDNCLINEYLDSNYGVQIEKAEAFYCCRLKKAIYEFNKIRNENFEEYLANANQKEISIRPSSKNLTTEKDWDSLYGKCETYSLNNYLNDSFLDTTVDFLLNTFASDTTSDDGVIMSFVNNNYQSNEFLLLPNAQTTINFKECIEITDYDCTSKYPSICSDASEPYNDRICEECYNARKNCHCDNPLKKSDDFRKIKNSMCNIHDSVLCLLQKNSIGPDICPNPCRSSYYKSFTTLDNWNITSLNISKEEMANISVNFVSDINNLINVIDKTSSIFPLGNHALWEAIYFLEEIFEEFWNILFLVTKLSGKPLPLNNNMTQITEYFKSFASKENSIDSLIQNYFNYIIDGINSSSNNNSVRNEINQRSIEVNLLFGAIPNPPAIINYYRTLNVLQKTIDALNDLRKNIQKVLNENDATSDERKILLKLNSLKIFETNTVEDAEVIKTFRDYLEEYRMYNIDFYHQNIAHFTLSFVSKKFSKIEYFQSYTFWNFLSDVGGIMGLYFGITMVTIYEIITFTFIDREPPESFTKKEKKLTRKTLYPKILLSDEPIPTLL